jgi:hypothetical protein
MVNTHDSTPHPEYLIKSIAEQGYSLETALADLIDNSITAGANKIEILDSRENGALKMFISDNGKGMTFDAMLRNMQFPSSSMESKRDPSDLGRFGLGLKTASFSQTRKLTVISRAIEDASKTYRALTWDVNMLSSGVWQIIEESEEKISLLMDQYMMAESNRAGGFIDFSPNTIIVWDGLYKYDRNSDIANNIESYNDQMSNVREYLETVFHVYLSKETETLQIRINNLRLKHFNPFPEGKGVRKIKKEQIVFGDEVLTLEGFILPRDAIKESKESNNGWVTKSKGLLDLEGIYIYRENRIILFGGWNGLIRRSPNLQLARLRVRFGNKNDDKLQLNVAKSKVVLPFEKRIPFLRYIAELKDEAKREYFSVKHKAKALLNNPKEPELFTKVPTGTYMRTEINNDFTLVEDLLESLKSEDKKKFRLFLRLVENHINKIRHFSQEVSFELIEKEVGLDVEVFKTEIINLKNRGCSSNYIKKVLFRGLGLNDSEIPSELKKMIEKI